MYDLFVIGGGSGGLRSSRTAKMLGAKVGLADFVKPSYLGNVWGLGGTCPNVGCVPKKLFHFAALCKDSIEDARQSGWKIEGKINHNWKIMRDKVVNDCKSTNVSIEKMLKNNEIDYFNSLATIKDSNTIELKDKDGKIEIIKSKNIIISVGGRPNYPSQIKNIEENCITSDDIFFLEEIPKKILVIGAGYISLECSGFLAALGSKVDICVRSKILKDFDQEIVERLKDYMQREVNFKIGFSPIELNKKDGKIEVLLKNLETNEETIEVYDKVLCATGRNPDLKLLGLENLKNVKFDKNNKVIRNNECQISDEGNVFAVGDIVSGGLELTPVAIREGQYLAEKLYGLEKDVEPINYSIVPTTIFTPLEYSSCGLSEEFAIQKYGKENIIVFNATIKPIEWLFNDRYPGKRICYCKIITLKSDLNQELEEKIKSKNWKDNGDNFYINKIRYSKNIVLGIHYLGPNAGEIMQGYGVAMSQTTTYGDFIKTVAIHPVVSETLVNLKTIKL